MILGTAGHIDHGKTALVKALTGVDTDRLAEEKRRGITIDLGFAPLVIDGVGTIGVVDVPGHEGFIRTMLAGASGIDLALLVIAADEGVMPQTREHLEILSLLGIQRAVVALTKSDLVSGDWLAMIRDDVSQLLAGTAFEGSAMVDVSALTGAGLDELRRAIAGAARDTPQRDAGDDLFRMPLDRAFTVKGTGTVVTGTIWSGQVTRDMALLIRPGDNAVRIRGIQSHGVATEVGGPGERAAIALAGCDVSEVARGCVLVADPAWVPSARLDVAVALHDDLRTTARTRLRFHIGTSDVGARLSGLTSAAVPAHRRFATLVLDEPVVARGGDRFVLRLPSPPRTIGGGVVTDPYPPVRRGKAARDRAARRLANDTRYEDRADLATMLTDAGLDGAAMNTLPIRTGLKPRDVALRLASLGAFMIAGRAYDGQALDELENNVAKVVADHSANHPLEPGVSLQTIRASSRAAGDVIDLLLNRLEKSGRVDRAGSLVRPAGWVATLDERDQNLTDAILHEICIEPSEPPSVGELVEKFGDKTSALLRKLERDGELERVSDDRYYSRSAVADMVGKLRTGLDAGKTYTPGELRELLGVSRKYLIPFLEFCDRKGLTERTAGGRALRAGG